jgi:hypothetical protein
MGKEGVMKKIPLILCLFSLLLVSTCKKNEVPLEESTIVLTNPSASVYSFSTGGWDLSVFVTANNTSAAEGFVCKAEYRFLLDAAVIATTDNISRLPLPDSSAEKWRGFVSTTNWQLFPDGISVIKYFDTGLHMFMNGQKPQKVEITLYIRNGTSQGDWDFTTKIMTEIIYTEISED